LIIEGSYLMQKLKVHLLRVTTIIGPPAAVFHSSNPFSDFAWMGDDLIGHQALVA
jgi:hypothetical protein